MFDNLLEQLMELKTVLSDMMTEDPNEQPDARGHVTTYGRLTVQEFLCLCIWALSLSQNTDRCHYSWASVNKCLLTTGRQPTEHKQINKPSKYILVNQ